MSVIASDGSSWSKRVDEVYLAFGDSQMAPTGAQTVRYYRYFREVQTGRIAYVANAAVGGTKSSDWLAAGSYFQDALTLLAAARATYPSARFAGFLMSLGTNDSHDASPTWTANVNAIAASFRSAISGATGVPIVYTVQPTTVPVVSAPWPSWAAVRAEQVAWASALQRAVITPEGPYSDGLHFSNAAASVVASNMYTQFPRSLA